MPCRIFHKISSIFAHGIFSWYYSINSSLKFFPESFRHFSKMSVFRNSSLRILQNFDRFHMQFFTGFLQDFSHRYSPTQDFSQSFTCVYAKKCSWDLPRVYRFLQKFCLGFLSVIFDRFISEPPEELFFRYLLKFLPGFFTDFLLEFFQRFSRYCPHEMQSSPGIFLKSSHGISPELSLEISFGVPIHILKDFFRCCFRDVSLSFSRLILDFLSSFFRGFIKSSFWDF